MKDPVDHILRPQLPWRRGAGGAITECGLNASKVETLTRDQYFKRLKDMGIQRCAMLTCMTCSRTAERWGTWEDDPRLALQREIEWECLGSRYRTTNKHGLRLHDELLALERLIAAHAGEFDLLVKEAEERRTWNERKTQFAARSASGKRGSSL